VCFVDFFWDVPYDVTVMGVRYRFRGHYLAAFFFVVSAWFVAIGEGGSAVASHGGMDAMFIDMDPSATPGNTATSVGSTETCASVNENNTLDADEDSIDTLAIDITAQGVPPYIFPNGGIIAFVYKLNYSEANLTVQTENANFLLDVNPSTGLIVFSDLLPDTNNDGFWNGAVADGG
jgi:hypothetical protein